MLSIYAQLPQNICMGLSEVFATVASLEFAYLAAPRSAQSLLMSLQFCSLGISSFIGKGYLSIYSTTSGSFDFSVSIKIGLFFSYQIIFQCLSYYKWTFTTYFFILAGLQLPFIIIVILCDRKFGIFKLNPHQIKANQFHGSSSTAPIG
jgi:hypothetical protein